MRLMAVLLGYLAGAAAGIGLGLTAAHIFFSNTNLAASLALVFVLAGPVGGVTVGLVLSYRLHPTRKDSSSAESTTNPNAEDNWGDTDYWNFTCRTVDPSLVADAVTRVKSNLVRVSASYGATHFVLIHSVTELDGRYVVSTVWQGLESRPDLARTMLSAWRRHSPW